MRGDLPAANCELIFVFMTGIQVIGRHWEEEKIIGVMHVIDQALGPRGFGPGSWTQQNQEDQKSQGSQKDKGSDRKG